MEEIRRGHADTREEIAGRKSAKRIHFGSCLLRVTEQPCFRGDTFICIPLGVIYLLFEFFRIRRQTCNVASWGLGRGTTSISFVGESLTGGFSFTVSRVFENVKF